ncbi:SOSS complex subunit B1 [Mucor ambiguus]|uniref:SOSS complex subunit B1 n=1 Tax=Mucor ambiguus TaxID=91626 RepID=A0A0C9MKR5_9FUNG|nr:SOSS complex subunit B1 [Mucor ambiguus]
MATLDQQLQQQQQHAHPKSHLNLVKDMHPMSRNIDCEVLVLQKDGDTTITRDGDQINRFLVADRTASILLNVWGEAGEYIQGGDILRITGADVRLRKGQLIMGTTKTCKIRRIGQDTMAFVEKPNMSEIAFNNNSNNNWSRNNDQQQQQQQQQQPSYKQSNRIPSNNVHNRPPRGYQNHPYSNANNNGHRGGGGGGRRGQFHDGHRGRGARFQQGIDNTVL